MESNIQVIKRQTNQNRSPKDYYLYLRPFFYFILVCSLSGLIFTVYDFNESQYRTLYILIVMIVTWVINYIDIVVVSFFPLIFGSLMTILPLSVIIKTYFSTTTLLYTTASMIGGGFRKHGLDKRFALYMMKGSSHQLFDITWRFTVVAGFITMWISDTATMTLLIPILESMLQMIEKWKISMELDNIYDPRVFRPPTSSMKSKELRVVCYLVMSYATSWGGFATMIGATTNFAFLGQLERQFGTNNTNLTFTTWFLYGFPMSLLHYVFAWFCAILCWEGPKYTWKLMVYIFKSLIYKIKRIDPNKDIPGVKEYLRASNDAIEKSSKWNFSEKVLTVIFPLIIIVLILRNPGIGGIKGWDAWFGGGGYTHDSMVTTVFALLLFAIPAHSLSEVDDILNQKDNFTNESRSALLSKRLLTWKEASHAVEWGIIWIFGGGFAIAEFFLVTGLGTTLSNVIGNFFQNFSPEIVLLFTCIVGSIFTEFMSVTNVISILTPVLNQVALNLCYNPLMLSFNALFAANAGVLFPISTSQNVLAYKAADITVPQMFRTGLLFKLFAVCIVFLCAMTYGNALFDFMSLPFWAIEYLDQNDPGHQCQ